MGKNARGQSSSITVQNANSGCMNKILHALDRRHRWQNVRKGLPNKRQGSGKHIIDGGSSETSSSTSTTQPPPPPPPPRDHPKKNKSFNKNEQAESADTRSKKFRIRSLISAEMAKRRGKHHWRRSSSPTRSPKRKTNSLKKTDTDSDTDQSSRGGIRCQSPSSTTKRKRKCDICAAMLTVSYLRQKGRLVALATQDEEEKKQRQQPTQALANKGLTKSFSFPLLAASTTKTADSELQQLKDKLRDLKDMQTTKEKLIVPMSQWKEVGVPKPMLTRPESFRTTPGSPSRKDKKETTNQPKSLLKQKIGFVIKVDARKEKRRILMDAVFHKIPYGRKSSKDPKKVNSEKLRTNSSTTTAESKTPLKKTSSSSEAMSKYRKLLSQTSTRDEKLQQHSSTDHNNKPKLFVAGDLSSGKKSHKRIRSLPNISPYDFMHNQEFPVKPTMNIHISISSEVFDGQRSTDHFEIYSERKNMPESTGKETKEGIKKGEVVDDQHLGVSMNASNHQEKINHQNESEASAVAVESGDKQETSSTDKEEATQEYLSVSHDHEEQNDHQKQVDDEDLGTGLNSSTHQEYTANQNEPRVELGNGMFKKFFDERTKLNNESESSDAVQKTAKNDNAVDNANLEASQNTIDDQEKDNSGSDHNNSDQDAPQNMEFSQETSDHTLEDTSQLRSSSYEVCRNTLDHQEKDESSSLIDIPNCQLTDEKKQHMFSMINDVDGKRPPNNKATQMIKTGFLHLDLETVKDNAEFQFVKQVLEKSGFLKNELVGEWYSSYQPIDPLLFEEVETSFLQNKLLEELDSTKDDEEVVLQKIINDHHLLLFDLVNEAILEIHNNTYTYCPHSLTYRSKVSPKPVGSRLLEEVWDIVNMYLSWKAELQQPSLDDAVTRDLAKGSGWMNLQPDAELVGIELEELLVDDLLDELVFDDLLM